MEITELTLLVGDPARALPRITAWADSRRVPDTSRGWTSQRRLSVRWVALATRVPEKITARG